MNYLLRITYVLMILTVVACSSDNECDNTCPDGSIQLLDCSCFDQNAEPCEGITCADGEILTVDCECVDSNEGNALEVAKTGFVCDEVWTNDKVYVLQGKVVVGDGCSLTIEAGTIIKAEDDPGTLASALIVAQGAQRSSW